MKYDQDLHYRMFKVYYFSRRAQQNWCFAIICWCIVGYRKWSVYCVCVSLYWRLSSRQCVKAQLSQWHWDLSALWKSMHRHFSTSIIQLCRLNNQAHTHSYKRGGVCALLKHTHTHTHSRQVQVLHELIRNATGELNITLSSSRATQLNHN